MSSHDPETPKGSPIELKRGRAGQDARAQQQLLDTLLTNLPGLVYRCRNDPQWTLMFVSGGCLELTGYQPDDFINNRKLDYASLIHPDDRERVWSEVQAAVAARRPFELQYRIHAADGKEKHVWERGHGVFSDADGLLALEGYVTDVTENKQIELTLRENEERFRGLTELSSDWYWEQDASFRFTLVTHSAKGKERFPTGETLGKTRWELPYLDVPPVVWAEHKRQLAAHEPFHDLVLKRRDAQGNIRYSSLSGVPILDRHGVFRGYRGTGHDITERVHAEETLSHRLAMEKLVGDLSRRFVHVGPDELDDHIVYSLGMIGKFSRVDRSYLFLVSTDESTMTNSHEWLSPGTESVRDRHQTFSVRTLPWFWQHMQRHEPFVVDRIADMPAAASAERKEFELESIQSLVIVPMVVGKRLLGFLGFDSVKQPKKWNAEDVQLLRVVSDMISSALERRGAEERIRKLARATEQTADSVIITDRDGVIEYVNPGFVKTTGYSRVEALGNKPSLVKSGEHGLVFYRNLWDTLLRGDSFHDIFVNRRKNGTLYYEEKTISPIKNEQGRITHYVSVGKDISERKQAEEEVRRTQHFLDSVVNNLPIMVFVKNAENLKFVRVNRTGEELLGLTSDELVGRSDYDFFPKEEADFFVAKDRAVLTGGKLLDIAEEPIHTKTRGKRILHTRKIPILDATGRPLYLLGISEDITERKLAEDEIARLGRILDSSSNEIYVFDAESLRFLQVNQGAQRNLGYTMGELGSLTPLDLKPEFTRESFETLIAPLRTGKGERINFTTVHRRKNGTDYPVEVQLQLMRHETPSVFVAIIQDITERRQVEERLSYLAYYDVLTGLPNRTQLLERLQQAMLDAGRVDRLVAVMFLDLDRFKYINDTLGHHVGDGLLKGVAERLKTCVRSGDIIARLGGDEFTVVLSSVAHADDVARVARKILENFAEPFRIEGHDLYTTPSIGITIYPFDDNDAEGLLKNADAAMYHAKEQGRNSFKFFTAELNVRAERRLKLETALRRALEREELSLHYQPQVDMKSGRLVGMEALLRWRNPELGSVSPAEFIPIAEETGLILPIGDWVLREACRQVKVWHATKFSFSKMQVAVNISGKQLRQKDFPDRVQKVLSETKLEPRYLDLELTESLLMVDAEETGDTMHTLHDMGISFSVDDFGTGYSSLSYLKRFPIDILKVDQSFVHDITSDPNDVAIVKTIIAMAHTLGMRVIAEGVETYEQLAFLRDQDCDGSQGYYCSKPLTANDFTELLVDWERISLGRCRAKTARRRVQKKSRPATRRRRVRK